MYKYHPIQELIENAETAIEKPVDRYGIAVYVGTDPDFVGNDIYIDPADTKGIELFREFATKMAEHYKTLDNG